MRLAGIEIGGTKLQVVLGNEKGAIMERRRYEVLPKQGAGGIQNQILAGVTDLAGEKGFDAIGIGFGGPIDWRTGTIFTSHHITGWNGFPLASWLREKWNVPIFADNDANVAVLAEARMGHGQGKDPVFYMTIGSGIGGGIVHQGRLYHGCFPGEVEIGHTRLPLDRSPERWPILEDACSGWSLDRQIREITEAYPHSPLAQLVKKDPHEKEARHLLHALQAGDSQARDLWERWIAMLVLGLSHVVHLFHPAALILGGGVTLMGPPLLEAVRGQLATCVMRAYQGTYSVELSALGEDVVPVGALILAAEGLKS